jgi:hypothetical protein
MNAPVYRLFFTDIFVYRLLFTGKAVKISMSAYRSPIRYSFTYRKSISASALELNVFEPHDSNPIPIADHRTLTTAYPLHAWERDSFFFVFFFGTNILSLQPPPQPPEWFLHFRQVMEP